MSTKDASNILPAEPNQTTLHSNNTKCEIFLCHQLQKRLSWHVGHVHGPGSVKGCHDVDNSGNVGLNHAYY